MPVPNSLESRLEHAKKLFDQEFKRLIKTRDLDNKKLKALYAKAQAVDEDLRDEKNRDPYRLFELKTSKILDSIYDLVSSTSQDATLQENDLRTLIEKASDAERYIFLKYYAKDDDDTSYLPATYGHIVKDETMPEFGLGLAQSLASFFAKFSGNVGMTGDTMSNALNLGHGLHKWDETYKPSSETTPLARFSKEIPTYSNPLPPLIAFTEARAEITSYQIANPVVMKKAGNALALLGCSGWKERDPHLEILDVSSFPNTLSIPVGLSGVASHLYLDGTRVFVADNSRIKSYSYSFGDGSLPVHTFDSSGYGSSMWTIANATRFVRSGRKGIAIWDLSNAPTHGDGEDVVGEEMDEPDTWRDNEDGEVELSTGSEPTQTVDAPALAEIDIWANHPTNTDHLVVAKASDFQAVSTVYTVSLETQQPAMRYLGHGACVTKIATSKDDTSAFLTVAEDGAARFYDLRTPLPVFTIAHYPEDRLGDGLYIHVDGHPFAILGGNETQQVKVWDIRALQPLYELSTGNNDVGSLVWDEERQTLYAQTCCRYMTRMGDHMDYRKAHFRSEVPLQVDMDDEDDDEDYEDYDDEDEDDDEERGWPEKAFHQEHSFGHPLDSGEHRLYKYSFKVGAKIHEVLPAYGDARWQSGDDYW